VFDEHVPLLEARRIKQEIEAFARRQLALGVLRIDALLATTEPRGSALFFEFANDLVHAGTPRWNVLFLEAGLAAGTSPHAVFDWN
jgi:hypothetical protein